jgi:hypothetical protein
MFQQLSQDNMEAILSMIFFIYEKVHMITSADCVLIIKFECSTLGFDEA